MYELLECLKEAYEHSLSRNAQSDIIKDKEVINYETAKFPQINEQCPSPEFGESSKRTAKPKQEYYFDLENKSALSSSHKVSTRNHNTTPGKTSQANTAYLHPNYVSKKNYDSSPAPSSAVFKRRNKSFTQPNCSNPEQPAVNSQVKQKLIDWMVSINLIKENSVDPQNFPAYCRNGVLLSDLITCIEGVFQ